MTKSASIVLVTTLLLAACGGGGGATSGAGGSGFTPSGSTNPVPDAGLPVTPATIATTNEIGSTLQSFASFESSELLSQNTTLAVTRGLATSTHRAGVSGGGSCTVTGAGNGMIANTPDLNNDPNSTEVRYFYDNACTQIARDTVRQWTIINSSSETVTTTQKQYAFDLPTTPTAVRSDVILLTNATLNPTMGGYPVIADGYDRSSTGALFIGSTKVLLSDFDLVMEPEANNTSTFCSDDAGFSIAAVDNNNGLQYTSYGWSAIVTSGTRTVNSDGSVTWTGQHQGNSYSGPAGSIQLTIGASPNQACPISGSAPYYSVNGPTALGTRNMTVTSTYSDGMLENLSITNATLASGMTLTVTTNTSAGPSSSNFINGKLFASGNTSSPVGVFNVDAFGDGSLTMTATGTANTFVISDWHVMHNPAVSP